MPCRVSCYCVHGASPKCYAFPCLSHHRLCIVYASVMLACFFRCMLLPIVFQGRSSVVISLSDLNVVGAPPYAAPAESRSSAAFAENRLSRRLSSRVSSQSPQGMHITTSIPEYSATRNSPFSLSSLLQPGGGVSGGNKSHASSSSSADANRHHSEPGLMYTTDIPAQNPNVTKHSSLSSGGSASGRHSGTKASIIKSRGEYSIQKSHRSADDTGMNIIVVRTHWLIG